MAPDHYFPLLSKRKATWHRCLRRWEFSSRFIPLDHEKVTLHHLFVPFFSHAISRIPFFHAPCTCSLLPSFAAHPSITFQKYVLIVTGLHTNNYAFLHKQDVFVLLLFVVWDDETAYQTTWQPLTRTLLELWRQCYRWMLRNRSRCYYTMLTMPTNMARVCLFLYESATYLHLKPNRFLPFRWRYLGSSKTITFQSNERLHKKIQSREINNNLHTWDSAWSTLIDEEQRWNLAEMEYWLTKER